MNIDYQRRAKGALEAVATLSDEARARIEHEDAGEVLVDVEVKDESGRIPIRCAMVWAWRPDRK